jgi:hypothetical protein
MVDPDKPSKCKVGITIDPEQRLVAYRTASPQCFFKALYNNIELRHERKILSLLKEIVQVDREYVHMNPSIVKNIIEGYFEDNEVEY